MSFFPITSSKSLVDARIDYVFLLVLEKKSYASFLSYLRTVPNLLIFPVLGEPWRTICPSDNLQLFGENDDLFQRPSVHRNGT